MEFCFLVYFFKEEQEQGVAGTLHVVVVEGNYCTTCQAFCQLFHPIHWLLSVSVDLHQVVLGLPTLFLYPLEAT